ncbi:MAG: MFS transporter [Haloferacaceae archaeon]
MSVARRARALVDVDHPGLVWLMSLNHGFNEFYSIIVPPLFPLLRQDLGIGYADTSLLVVVFFATYSIAQLPVGRVANHYSARRLLVGGQALLSVGIALVAFAPTYETMLAGMVVAGVGGSTYHPTGMSVISDAESDSTHGRSMGIHGMLGTFGTVVAPVVVGGLAVAYGWRPALLAGAGAGLAFAAALAVLYPRAVPGGEEETTLLAALRESMGGGTLRTAGSRAFSFLRSPPMLVLIGLFAVVGAEVRAVQSFTTLFAANVASADGASTDAATSFGNQMFALTMVAAGVASTAAGAGVDRMDRRLFAGACFAGTAVVVAAVSLLPLGRVGLAVGFAVLGVVMYSVYPATNALAAGLSTEDSSGDVFAVTQTAAALGGAAGPFILGFVADATTLSLGFLSTAGIAGVGVLVVAAATVLEA